MTIDDLKNKNIVIWGTGREALSAANLLQKYLPEQNFTFVDEDRDAVAPNIGKLVTDNIDNTLNDADVIIKSPGISLYHSKILAAQKHGAKITSLLNLWFSLPRNFKTICVTGTKGKSTTASLIAHALKKLGKDVELAGNIGTAIGTQSNDNIDYMVIEMSSYQTADFNGSCDIAVITSLYPEHLDWHGSLAQYYHDKTRLLLCARTRIVHEQTTPILKDHNVHVNDTWVVHDDDYKLDALTNEYLLRLHNRSNVCNMLRVIETLGLSVEGALCGIEDFIGLPHRQQELGVKNDVLYVNDSISTTPQTTLFALKNYADKELTLIVGGQDRGLDYTSLIDYIIDHVSAVICMGTTGNAIYDQLVTAGFPTAQKAKTMRDAITVAQKITRPNGVVLLSPAAPSYDMYKSFIERGELFAKEVGFK